MSEPMPGAGWWQASDSKWCEPAAISTPKPTTTRRSSSVSRFVPIRLFVSVLLVVSGALVGLTVTGSPASASGGTYYAAVGGTGTACSSVSPCALTEALSSATSGSTIDLAAGTYQTANETSFTISTSITVQPTTPGSTAILEGNHATVVVVNTSVTATVSGVSIEDGSALNGGSGIANSGTLTVEDSTISGNNAVNDGGGIYNSGNLNVEDSTISSNAAQYAGGGIYNSDTLTIQDSTISGNGAGGGGGIYNSDTLTIQDSTISGNTAIACLNGIEFGGQSCVAPLDGGGGGIYNQGNAAIEAATITGNSVATGYEGAFGGGINNSYDGSLTLAADITAKQSAGGDCSNIGTVTDAGYNIDDDGTCALSSSHNSISDSTVIDDYLGSLGPSAGPTETVPLLAAPSPTTSSADPALGVIPSTFDLPIAVNGVSLACSIPDQRGVTRDQPCDIGAFSLGLDTVAFVADGGATVASITGLDGSSITLPSDTYPGYTFNGWFTAASDGTEVGGAGSSYTIPLGGSALYAQWAAPCSLGYYSTTGSAPCTAAPPGTYVDTNGADAATACAVGTYQPSAGESSCLLADPGTSVATTGATTESACAIGTYQPSTGQSSCLLADPGSYVASTGATSESSCSAGAFSASAGATACTLAAPGTYVDTTGAITAIDCALGTYQPSAGQTSCTPAPLDTYVDTTGATSATECPAGTYTLTTGSTSVADCLTPAPTITKFTPSSGPVGTVVTIKGTNLSGATKVTFNGVKGTITSDTATKIKVKVPYGATTGKIQVKTPGGKVKTATAFTVT
jgi:hypothetical protein